MGSKTINPMFSTGLLGKKYCTWKYLEICRITFAGLQKLHSCLFCLCLLRCLLAYVFVFFCCIHLCACVTPVLPWLVLFTGRLAYPCDINACV